MEYQFKNEDEFKKHVAERLQKDNNESEFLRTINNLTRSLYTIAIGTAIMNEMMDKMNKDIEKDKNIYGTNTTTKF